MVHAQKCIPAYSNTVFIQVLKMILVDNAGPLFAGYSAVISIAGSCGIILCLGAEISDQRYFVVVRTLAMIVFPARCET